MLRRLRVFFLFLLGAMALGLTAHAESYTLSRIDNSYSFSYYAGLEQAGKEVVLIVSEGQDLSASDLQYINQTAVDTEGVVTFTGILLMSETADTTYTIFLAGLSETPIPAATFSSSGAEISGVATFTGPNPPDVLLYSADGSTELAAADVQVTIPGKEATYRFSGILQGSYLIRSGGTGFVGTELSVLLLEGVSSFSADPLHTYFGDIDQSGKIDSLDRDALLAVMNQPYTQDPRADLSRDGVINYLDLSILLAGFGQPTEGFAPPPAAELAPEVSMKITKVGDLYHGALQAQTTTGVLSANIALYIDTSVVQLILPDGLTHPFQSASYIIDSAVQIENTLDAGQVTAMLTLRADPFPLASTPVDLLSFDFRAQPGETLYPGCIAVVPLSDATYPFNAAVMAETALQAGDGTLLSPVVRSASPVDWPQKPVYIEVTPIPSIDVTASSQQLTLVATAYDGSGEPLEPQPELVFSGTFRNCTRLTYAPDPTLMGSVLTIPAGSDGGIYTVSATSGEAQGHFTFRISRAPQTPSSMQIFKAGVHIEGSDILVVPLSGVLHYSYTTKVYDAFGVEIEVPPVWTFTTETEAVTFLNGTVSISTTASLNSTFTLKAETIPLSQDFTISLEPVQVDWSPVDALFASATFQSGDKNGKLTLPSAGTASAAGQALSGTFSYPDPDAIQAPGVRNIAVRFTVSGSDAFAGQSTQKSYNVNIAAPPLPPPSDDGGGSVPPPSDGGGGFVPPPEEKPKMIVEWIDEAAEPRIRISPVVEEVDGVSITNLKPEDLDAIREAQNAMANPGSTQLVLRLEPSETNRTSFILPSEFLDILRSSSSLLLDSGIGTIELLPGAMQAILGASPLSGSTVQFNMSRSTENGQSIYDLSLEVNGVRKTSFGGQKIAIVLPLDPSIHASPAQLKAAKVLANGGVRLFFGSTVQPDRSTLRIELDSFSRYTVYDASSVIRFSDVADTRWSADYIYSLRLAGIAGGYPEGTYKPSASITRAEFVKLLAGVLGADVSSYTGSNFKDVDASLWYAPYIEWAYQNKISGGTGESKFSPNETILRQDIATMLFRSTKTYSILLEQISSPEPFTDRDRFAPYAGEAIRAMQTAGILNGFSDSGGGFRFNPADRATREEAAKMLFALYLILQG